MIAAKKSSEKLNAELFADVPVLQRKWQAARYSRAKFCLVMKM
jgi:hypothetical protein